MQKSFIIILITGIIVALFAGLNNAMVTLNLVFVKFELSLSIVILISVTIGALAMFFMNLVKNMKLNKQVKVLSAKLTELGVDLTPLIGKSAKQVKAEKKAAQRAQKQAEKEAEKEAKKEAKKEADSKSSAPANDGQQSEQRGESESAEQAAVAQTASEAEKPAAAAQSPAPSDEDDFAYVPSAIQADKRQTDNE